MRFILILVFAFSFLGSSAQKIDVLHYDFTIDLRESHDSISGLAKIKFIKLDHADFTQLDLVSAKRKGKGMKIENATLSYPAYSKLSFKHDEEKTIFITPKLKKGDTAEIQLIYSGIPADGLIISKNRFGDRTFFF